MATIKQIASLAGVSRGTVDRVLHNRGIVSAETEKKIKEIAKSLKYTPNKVARKLALNQRNIKLGFIMYNSTNANPFFCDMVIGIESKIKELEEYGVTVEIRYTGFNNLHSQLSIIDELVSIGIHGLAITPVNNPLIAEKLRSLSKKGIPVVTVNSDINNSGRIAYVGSNYAQSGSTAGGLMRLVTEGNANVGIIIGSNDILCHTERVEAFIENLSNNCPQARVIEIVENHDDDFESYAVTKELLIKKPEINSLFLAAAGVYGACRAVKDLKLDQKIKIISFDCVPSTKALLEEGVITATIGQQPKKQGSLPLDILFNYLGMDIKPLEDKYHTNIEIIIRENL